MLHMNDSAGILMQVVFYSRTSLLEQLAVGGIPYGHRRTSNCRLNFMTATTLHIKLLLRSMCIVLCNRKMKKIYRNSRFIYLFLTNHINT